jgi:hypothetical protein
MAVTRKPGLRKKASARRIVGPKAVGQKMSGLRRRLQQTQTLNGYWTVINGKSVFVRVRAPVPASAQLARARDRQKKRMLGR